MVKSNHSGKAVFQACCGKSLYSNQHNSQDLEQYKTNKRIEKKNSKVIFQSLIVQASVGFQILSYDFNRTKKTHQESWLV